MKYCSTRLRFYEAPECSDIDLHLKEMTAMGWQLHSHSTVSVEKSENTFVLFIWFKRDIE